MAFCFASILANAPAPDISDTSMSSIMVLMDSTALAAAAILLVAAELVTAVATLDESRALAMLLLLPVP